MPIEPHILFVDDNPDICELVQAVLQGAGFRVSTSDNTAGALHLARERTFTHSYWITGCRI
jgi:DNA-binding response OmpR family regulator